MKVLVAIDSFKGSVSSLQAGDACAKGIKKADKESEVWVKGLADGGEGTLDVLVNSMDGIKKKTNVHDAYGRKIACSYGIIEKEKLAIIEIAQIVGLPMDDRHEPLKSGTYGVGELILHCLKDGYEQIIIGLGGSSTNDGGMGMLEALGVQFFDKEGKLLDGIARNLAEVSSASFDNLNPLVKKAKIMIACDVKNPLCGNNGATYIYGPQKGVLPSQLAYLDQSMERYGRIVNETKMNEPGAGAAGGLGFALMSVMKYDMKPGIEIVMEEGQFDSLVKQADLVISGEGKIDAQTAMGKGPGGLAKLAKKYHKTMILIGGSVQKEAQACHELGITAYFSIQSCPIGLDQAMDVDYTLKHIESTSEQLMRFYLFHV